MIPGEYKPLIDKLTSATTNGGRNWNVTSDDCKFTLNIGKNGVIVRYFRAWDVYTETEESVVRFEIMNPLGEPIDGFSVGETDGGYNEMYSFYEMARRNALQIDKTIAELLRDLD